MLGLGYLNDLHDPRDFLLGALPAVEGVTPPAAASLAAYEHAPLNQGQAQACVGFAASQGIFTRWGVLGGAPFMPSASFLWWLARQDHGAQEANAPTYIRSAFKKARRLGVASDVLWPHGDALAVCAKQPDHLAFRGAIDQAFPLAYYRIEATGEARCEAIRTAITLGFPVVFGTRVNSAFLRTAAHAPLAPFTDASIGGHAMAITEYTPVGVAGPNSWGTRWGNGGRFALSWAWVASSLMGDVWAIDCTLP